MPRARTKAIRLVAACLTVIVAMASAAVADAPPLTVDLGSPTQVTPGGRLPLVFSNANFTGTILVTVRPAGQPSFGRMIAVFGARSRKVFLFVPRRTLLQWRAKHRNDVPLTLVLRESASRARTVTKQIEVDA